jgi:hypothetical protein
MKKITVLFFTCLAFTHSAFATVGENAYCTINGVYQVSSKGQLIKISKTKGSFIESFQDFFGLKKFNRIYDDAEGSEFTVNRAKGSYNNRFVQNDNWKKHVLDYGSKDQSYKLLSTSTGGFMHTQYLQIDIFSEDIKKPFRLLDAGLIFVGKCT